MVRASTATRAASQLIYPFQNKPLFVNPDTITHHNTMSTQAAQSILFTHTSPQQGFKLLELPPELVEALSSKEPPT